MTDSLEKHWHTFNSAAGSPAWLAPVRERALRAFTQDGFPTTRDEDWKYTSLADFQARVSGYLRPADDSGQADEAIDRLLQKLPGTDAETSLLVFSHGRFDVARSRVAAPDGIAITPLTSAAANAAGPVAGLIEELVHGGRHRLGTLNAAFMTDGAIIDVAPHAQPNHSVLIAHLSSGLPIAAQPRIVVSLGEGAGLDLVEVFAGEGDGLTNAVTQIVCGQAARISYVKLQNESASAQHLASQQVSLARDSRIGAAFFDTGSALARNDLTVRLADPGAEADLRGLFVAGRGQHIDHHTNLEHAAGNTTSREAFRGVIDAGGRGVFNGRILVEAGADGTDAELSNRNLVLDAGAEIDTKPELEIYADDVKCAHGATTGQLDRNARFYLRSRGIAEADARRMLIAAFAAEIVNTLDSETLRNHVNECLHGKLPGSDVS